MVTTSNNIYFFKMNTLTDRHNNNHARTAQTNNEESCSLSTIQRWFISSCRVFAQRDRHS